MKRLKWCDQCRKRIVKRAVRLVKAAYPPVTVCGPLCAEKWDLKKGGQGLPWIWRREER